MQFHAQPVDDDQYSVQVEVEDGDDIIGMTSSYSDTASCDTRMTIEETLALIGTLTEAIAAALVNRASSEDDEEDEAPPGTPDGVDGFSIGGRD